MQELAVFTVIENIAIAKDIMKLTLRGNTEYITSPGQFVNIAIDGFYLRRPISVCDINNDVLTIIYKVVGQGTLALSKYESGKELSILCGLGNGYNIDAGFEKPLLIGGGVGVPPLYYLAKQLIKKGITPEVVLGFNDNEGAFLIDEFKALGANVHVATVDGSLGTKGFVTDVIKNLNGYDYFFSCGPEPMLKAISNTCSCEGQLSFEERMGCGFGACMGCSCETKYGSKRICKDGPVLLKSEVIW